MKKIIKTLIFNKINAKLFLTFLLKVDKYLYFIIGQYASLYYDGKHPKHDIIKYEDWFISNLRRDWNVVDVGSNSGHMAYKISKSVKNVTGIEIDQKLYNKSIQLESENLKFINADATTFNYANLEKIHCVTLSNVLEHIEQRVVFLKSLLDKVNWKQEPLFLIRVPMIDRHWVVFLKKKLGVDYRLDETHFIEYTKETFYDEINQANLKVVQFDVRWGEIYAVVSK